MKKFTCDDLVSLQAPEVIVHLWGGPHDFNETLVSVIDGEIPKEIWIPWLGLDRKVRPPRVARYAPVEGTDYLVQTAREAFYRFVGERVAMSPDDLGAAFYGDDEE